MGRPWRGNLRDLINDAETTRDWIAKLFGKCDATPPDQPCRVTMAIDTPLGFSEEFRELATGLKSAGRIGEASGENRYLFRYTERHLIERGVRPLSAVQDKLGSQATKGMHVLAKFAPTIECCGVWTDGANFLAIETYPTPARESREMMALLAEAKSLSSADEDDARICALVAYLFANRRDHLDAPPSDVPEREGWIWLPKGAFSRQDSTH